MRTKLNRTFLKQFLTFLFSPIGILFYKPNRVLFRGFGEYDNSWALYKYCQMNRKDLEIKFLCDEKPLNKLYCYAMMSSYSVIFCSDACDKVFNPLTKVVNLGHGTPFKKVEQFVKTIALSKPEFVIPSLNVSERFRFVFKLSDCSFYNALSPRIDLLVSNESRLNSFRGKINFKKGEKVVGVFLTFRRKENTNKMDESAIIPFDVDFKELNNRLSELNIRLVIKLHRAFDNVRFDSGSYSNIVFLHNCTCLESGLEPTAFMSCCDALVTDYSSAFIDYLLLDRPIFFFIGDIEKFKSNVSDGFLFDNVLNLMPGDKFSTQEEIEKSLESFAYGSDSWREERKNICRFFNDTEKLDGKCSEKIMNHYFPR